MSEKEARAKWCPLIKSDHGKNNCIVSACMMWQWKETKVGKSVLIDRQKGYCGLVNLFK